MPKTKTPRKVTRTKARTVGEMTLEEFTRAVQTIGIETAQEIFRLVTEKKLSQAEIHRHVMARMDKQAAAKRKRAVKGGAR
jgi:hypothetical protein